MKCINDNIFLNKNEIILEIINSLKNKAIMKSDLPNLFIPASNSFFQEQFYWDSFFIMQGLDKNDIESQKLILGIVENFFYMIDKFGFIPNSYELYNTRSQPPFLSSMILEVYDIFKDLNWLTKAYHYLLKEYKFWMKEPRLTSIGLNRYYDEIHPNGLSRNAEDESGWDFTPRFKNKAEMAIPIDLNSLLYKYELDLAYISKKINHLDETKKFEKNALKRKELIMKYLWCEKDKIFYDYDLELNKHFEVKSLAIYYPMFVNIVDETIAKELFAKIHLFEQDFGLSVCDSDYNETDKQWNYPNGWAPLHYIVFNGFKNYGFIEKANKIAYKWVNLCFNNYLETGFWEEKYSVIKDKNKTDDLRYEHQNELYWTLGVFIYLYKKLKLI